MLSKVACLGFGHTHLLAADGKLENNPVLANRRFQNTCIARNVTVPNPYVPARNDQCPPAIADGHCLGLERVNKPAEWRRPGSNPRH